VKRKRRAAKKRNRQRIATLSRRLSDEGFVNGPRIAFCRSRTIQTHTRPELKPADSTQRFFCVNQLSTPLLWMAI